MKTIMDACGHKSVGVTLELERRRTSRTSRSRESFDLLKPCIKSCHINDLENDAKGTYPYRELFKLLREANYDRYTLIEVGKAYPDVAEGTEYLKRYKADLGAAGCGMKRRKTAIPVHKRLETIAVSTTPVEIQIRLPRLPTLPDTPSTSSSWQPSGSVGSLGSERAQP